MKNVYFIEHSYDTGKYLTCEEFKILGVYETREEAEAKIDEYMQLPGYKELGRDKFTVYEEIIDGEELAWEEGFASEIIPMRRLCYLRFATFIGRFKQRRGKDE